jgi:hypothetical protein
MSAPHYIGNSPIYGQFVQQTVSGSGVGPHLLQQTAPSAESLLVVQAGVVLKAGVDYTISGSGSQITFSALKAPSAGNTWILFQGQSLLNASSSTVEVNSFVGDGVDTTFVLTNPPASQDSIAVFVDGLFQSYTTNWTLSGSTITFTAAPDNLSPIDVYHFKVTFSGGYVEIPNTVTAFTALAGVKYIVTPPLAGTTVTLPSSPNEGDEVQLVTAHATYQITVTSGDDIDASASDYVMAAKASKTFVYTGAYGWAVK